MAKEYPDITWLIADLQHMTTLKDASFDVALDKSTLDAMVGGGSLWPGQVEDAVRDRVGAYVSEVNIDCID
jgi:hypothetical protein